MPAEGNAAVQEEVWKDIPGYEGQYQVSNMGRVKSLPRTIHGGNQNGRFDWETQGQILRPAKRDRCGHLAVVLNNPRKTCGVHQLVMLAFEGPPPENMYALHNNGNPEDNRLSNLRYDTQSENILDVYRQGKAWKTLTADDVQAIRFGLCCGMTCTELGAMYNVGRRAVSKIKHGVRYAWLK